MDIDPVDDGPREVSRGIVPMSPAAMPPPPADASGPANEISKEEEARQAIEMLRGDDVSQRVAAACRLQAVASVLGPERTREVSKMLPICNFKLHNKSLTDNLGADSIYYRWC